MLQFQILVAMLLSTIVAQRSTFARRSYFRRVHVYVKSRKFPHQPRESIYSQIGYRALGTDRMR